MSIRTLEELEDALDSALAWRRKEISAILAAVRRATGRDQALQLRAGVALLYAHWEGFIKNAADAYIEYVAFKRLTCEKLTSNFVALALGRMLNDVQNSRRVRFRIEAINFLRNEVGTRANIPTKGIDTASNLNSEVLQDVLMMVGVDKSPYETKFNLIDESLLAARNRIAHGEYLEVDATRYEDLQREITEMMILFRNQVGNSAATQAYLRT